MEYKIYKLRFKTGVHFGNGLLNDSINTVKADTLFSALYLEALNIGKNDELYKMANDSRFFISDAMPYVKDDIFLVPKPMIQVKTDKKQYKDEIENNSVIKKRVKNIKFLPITNIDDFLNGDIEKIEDDSLKTGFFEGMTKARVRSHDDKGIPVDTLPYHVGVYNFDENAGLYIITAYEDEEVIKLIKELLTSLSHTGIGGKRTSGLGKFDLEIRELPSDFANKLFTKKHISDKIFKKYMTLSTSLPKDDELEETLENSSYLMEKRSGFIYSTTYSDEFRRKKDMYVFSSGSCFENLFDGDVYDVSEGQNTHKVYRYAKPLFLGVER